MPQGLEDIKKTLTRISRGDSVMELLMEFERTLDGVEIYAYPNWIDGELVKGPDISKYWFCTSWMYPQKRMPDPEGAVRLEKIGCKVFVNEDILEKPVKVRGPEDWENPRTKKAKLQHIPVYVVHIHMPMKFIVDKMDILDNYLTDETQQETDELADQYVPPPEEISVEPEEDMGMDDELGEL